jgi:lipoprotein-anchoring transpeptidase ErfK/SrfK
MFFSARGSRYDRSGYRSRVAAGFVAVFTVIAMTGCSSSGSRSQQSAPTDGQAPAVETTAEAPAVVRAADGPVTLPTPTTEPSQGIEGETIDMPAEVATGATAFPVGYSVYEPGKTVVAQALPGENEIAIYDTADATTPSQMLKNPVRKTIPLVFVAEGKTANRLLVQLPVRPNGSKGWIDITKVSLAAHEYRIEVSLSTFQLTAFNGTEIVLQAPVGVGRDDRPSPSGTYYITELLKPPSADSIYGSHAYGLSGFSEVLRSFNGGQGQVGIHGTNDPSSIGTEVSSGCIRMNNEDIQKLVPVVPLGTPVKILS